MREMLGAFAGNELVLGVVLGNWLLLMGLGTSLGRWFSAGRIAFGALPATLVFTAVLPFGQMVALRGMRQFVFQRGASTGVIETVIASFAVLLPYCIVAGLFLALACRALDVAGSAHGAGRVYALDSVGSVVGGALFSFVLVFWLDHFQALCVPAALSLMIAGWMAGEMMRPEVSGTAFGANAVRRKQWALAAKCAPCLTFLLAAGCVVWAWRWDPDAATSTLQFPAQSLLFSGYSPYGRLVVTSSGGQTNFYENGLLVAATPNIEAAEEAAHYAMAQRPEARKVLLIGGLLTGAAREVLRYDVAELDCVEMDPLVTATGKAFLPGEQADPRLRVIATDARRFVRQGRDQYDVIIVALPDPSTAQLNRFFTHEFFLEAHRRLNPGGVLSFAVGRYENYASAELAQVLSCVWRTVRRSFKEVRLLPGGRVYFVASDGPLRLEVAAALEKAGVQPRWVNRHYLQAVLAPDRLAAADRAAQQEGPVNRDFKPVLYFLHLRHWASQFQRLPGWLVAVMLAPAVYLLFLRGASGAIFASGFAGASLEVVLLLGMQVVAGAVYRQLGVVVTLFMAGLAAGALWGTRRRDANPGSLRRALGLLAAAVAGCAAVLPLLLSGLTRLNTGPSGETLAQAAIGLATFGIAFLAGAQFPVANALDAGARNAAVRLYTADFLGASAGALLTSTLLLPLIGVVGVCAVVGALNALAAAVLIRKVSLA